MTIENYIDNINQRYKLGNATEHTFRGDLQQLLESLVPEIRATNEPKRQSCGAPDYILTKKDIPVGFIEAKDVGDKDLEGKKKSVNKEQFDRYKASLDNLIFTDYIDFHLYNDGEFITKIAIAEITEKGIIALPQNFARFENLIKDFCVHIGQNIKSSKKLAEMMAGKARLLSDVIGKALTSDETHNEDSTLKEQMTAFKSILIHDITPKGFADVYAQTIAYGMFAARLHDPTLDTFSRQEAAELIPKSNPFLRKLFGYIAGPDIDDRIKWIVENLAEIFLACNVEEILKNYGKTTKMEDPIIHFYETFLAEYDPKLRKARGVWYTPAPVVNFIVRAVDDILKSEFDLPQGLADTSKTKITVNTQTPDKRSVTGYKQMEQEVHKVQILDPATGTGTFLAEVIKHVNKKFKGQEGIWSGYVENHLLPRLNGFELLMASYAMAHLQLDLLLKETGFKPTKDQRTKVYLTNSLDEYHPDTGTLFANWLSSEANEANYIKRDTPVMCIIGNPPYSGESANKGEWIMELMEAYKKEPGGKEKLKERNPKAINDDYVKFLRYGQHFIEKNGSGVLAFINPHGFLDNPTFRGMRWHLLKTYDKIYTIDLHGNSTKKETGPDGSADINVFDIQQGVSINVFVKTEKKTPNALGKVFHYDVYGKRDSKYDFLSDNSLETIEFKELKNVAPNYFMVPKDYQREESFSKGIDISELFKKYGMGVATGNDTEFIAFDKKELQDKFEDHKLIQTIDYRFFDKRFIYNDYSLIERGREGLMRNMIGQANVGLISLKRARNHFSSKFGIVNSIADKSVVSTLDNGYLFPLYLYPETNGQQTIEEKTERKPNLNQEIVNKIALILDLKFTNEKETKENTFAPIDILDFIYAVLHSRKYRNEFKEFLKTDFPKIPYPKDKNTFWKLVKLGGEIRQIHLLESPKVDDFITTYPKGGDNVITTKVARKDWELFDEEKGLGRIWINDEQYFDNIPLTAWEFYIGGYQPAQKWLKDRKERTLEFDDILHYQKIIVALSETDRLMKEIDKIITI
jgi:predicted helicase